MKIKNIITKKIKYGKIADFNLICPIICGLIFLTGFFIGRNYPDILNQAVIQTERHTALITAIATVALVLVTILLVEFNKKLWRTQNKPLLHFYKDYYASKFTKIGSSPDVRFFVINVGNGPATKVKLKFNQKKIYFEVLSPREKSQICEIQEELFTQEIIIDDIMYNDVNGLKYSQEKVILKLEHLQDVPDRA